MLTIVIILAAAGVVMIAMEVILPSGIIGVAGLIAVGVSILLSATSPELAHLGPDGRFMLAGGIIVVSIIFLGLWLKFFTRAGMVKKHLLSGGIDGTATFNKYQELLGQSGLAETDLRPSGKARIDGKKHDVVAEVGMIDRGSAVKVVKVEGSKVVVRVTT